MQDIPCRPTHDHALYIYRKQTMEKIRAIAVIHARGRGTTLPRKNIYPILGKPMLWHFLTEMKKCTFLEGIAVWTESEEVAEVVRECGCVHLERPLEMVHYTSGFSNASEWSALVTEQLMEHFQTTGNVQIHLNCNHTLLKASTLETMFDKLMEDPMAGMITPIYRIEPHIYMENPHTGSLFPVWESKGLDRQKYPQLFRLVGINIRHAPRCATGINRELFHEIPWSEGRDIQHEDDIEFAEFVLGKRYRTDV